MRKNAISLLLTCAMLTSLLAGCGASSSSETTSASEAAPSSEAASSSAASGEETATAETGAVSVSALPDQYNDSSVTGADWDAWVAQWDSVATDYTKVSLTPGADETQLNFAWYSKTADGAATPVVHFGTDPDALQEFTGESGTVDPELTGGEAYDYNHVTVTGLTENTTYYYTVEKSGVETEPVEYTTGSFSDLNLLYVGDPQIGASTG